MADGSDGAKPKTPLDGGLPITARQEQFSLAFVKMIAAAAGCSIKWHATDYDGVDITIASSAEYEKHYCPEFELQLKCTTQHDLLRDTYFSWRMDRDPFVKLTHGKRYNEAFLGVLVSDSATPCACWPPSTTGIRNGWQNGSRPPAPTCSSSGSTRS